MGVSSPFVLTHNNTPSSARTREVSAENKNMLISTTTAAHVWPAIKRPTKPRSSPTVVVLYP